MRKSNPEQTAWIKEIAQAALAADVVISDAPDGPLAAWLRANVAYPPEHEFFMVFLTACELADLQAQREGYANQYERAWAIVEARRAAGTVDSDADDGIMRVAEG
jgi:hypothetical protein